MHSKLASISEKLPTSILKVQQQKDKRYNNKLIFYYANSSKNSVLPIFPNTEAVFPLCTAMDNRCRKNAVELTSPDTRQHNYIYVREFAEGGTVWGRVSTFYVGDVAAIAQGMLTCTS